MKETILDFEPIFYIIDKGLCRVMFVRKEEKYEYKGLWFDWKEGFYPACLGKSSLQEYVTNYDFTKEKAEAYITMGCFKRGCKPMTTEQMQNLNQNPDFIY